MAAPIQKLGDLHELLTDIMLDELKMYREESIPVPSSDKAAIAKFLKDNNVTADPTDQAELESLRNLLLGKQGEKRTALAEKIATTDVESLNNLYGIQ